MSRWCNCYNCWCEDVHEIMEGNEDCGTWCNDCEDCVEILPGGKVKEADAE